MRKTLISIFVLTMLFGLGACNFPTPAVSDSAERTTINPPAEIIPTIQITVTDGNLDMDGLQAVYSFSLSGFCQVEIELGGNEKLCEPLVTINSANGASTVFTGKPGEQTTLPLINLDDYRAEGTVVTIDLTSYEVKAIEEMPTGLTLKLAPQ